MLRSQHFIGALLIAQSLGCASVRSTYHLGQAEQAVNMARDSEAADLAPYEWTMTQEYILKAREEWGNSAYGDAEVLSKKANEWAARAEQAALRLHRYQEAEGMHEFVPEEVEINEDEDEEPFRSSEERLEILELEDE
jgi:hypothetical protein